MLKGQKVSHFKRRDLQNIRKYLKYKNKIVLLSFINIGVNVALRFSDLTTLKFEHVQGDKIVLIEKKTKKKRIIYLNSFAIKNLRKLKIYYREIGFPSHKGYIFKSLSNYNKKYSIDKPLSQVALHLQFKVLKDELNIQYPIGTHSLRKTWGHRVYKRTNDIAIIMTALNHSSARETLKYIGIEDENMKKLYKNIII